MLNKLIVWTLILNALIISNAFSEKIKKGVTIYVPLTVGSFEITAKRFKGGKIRQIGDSLEVTDIYVPTKKLTSGIDLRDEHMHERIKNENVIVKEAKGKDGAGKGVIVIRDIEKEFSFTYKKLNEKYLRANFELNLTDFKIPNLSYAGVGVEDIIKLEVTLPYSK